MGRVLHIYMFYLLGSTEALLRQRDIFDIPNSIHSLEATWKVQGSKYDIIGLASSLRATGRPNIPRLVIHLLKGSNMGKA